MENTSTPRADAQPALAPTRLDLIVRGGVASAAYLDVERTLNRAREMLSLADRPAPIAAYRALATRLGAHAEQLFRDHVVETATTPSGITVSLPRWDADLPRLTYRLLLTYRQQAEARIAELVRGARPDFVQAVAS